MAETPNSTEGTDRIIIGTAITAILAKRSLLHIQRYFPDAIVAIQTRALHAELDSAIAIGFENAKMIEGMAEIRKEKLSGSAHTQEELILTGALVGLVGRHPDGLKLGLKTEDTDSIMGAVFTVSQKDALPPIQKIAARIVDLQIYECRIPSCAAEPELDSPGRALFLLRHYWAFLGGVIAAACRLEMTYHPHPAMPFVVNVMARINICLDRISVVVHANKVRSAIKSLVDTLLDGELDAFKIEEWVNPLLGTIQLFIEESRLQIKTNEFSLLSEEETFLTVATKAQDDFEAKVKKGWINVQKNVEKKQAPLPKVETPAPAPANPPEKKDDPVESGQKSSRHFLYVSNAEPPALDPSTVFFETDGDEIAQAICKLFKEAFKVEDVFDGEHIPSIFVKAADAVPLESQILLEEAIDGLQMYDDPDPGVYDPQPNMKIMVRAQYATRARDWENRLRSRAKAPTGAVAPSVAASSIEEAVTHLQHVIERHRLIFLFFSAAKRYAPNNRSESWERVDRERCNKIVSNPALKIDYPGEFLFKFQHVLDDYAQSAISAFGPGEGGKPKVLDREGKWVEYGSLPLWEIDEGGSNYLERSADGILDACKRISREPMGHRFHSIVKSSRELMHDEGQVRWYDVNTIRWNYLTRLDGLIASIKGEAAAGFQYSNNAEMKTPAPNERKPSTSSILTDARIALGGVWPIIELLREIDEREPIYFTNDLGEKDYPFAEDDNADRLRLLEQARKNIFLAVSYVRVSLDAESKRDEGRVGFLKTIESALLTASMVQQVDELKRQVREIEIKLDDLRRSFLPDPVTQAALPHDHRTSLEMSMKLKPGEGIPTDVKVLYVDPAVASLTVENSASDKSEGEWTIEGLQVKNIATLIGRNPSTKMRAMKDDLKARNIQLRKCGSLYLVRLDILSPTWRAKIETFIANLTKQKGR